MKNCKNVFQFWPTYVNKAFWLYAQKDLDVFALN